MSRPKVYDCFSFFNELDILEWRLAELYTIVDKFVLVESTHTHSGKPKPLYFGECRQRFHYWNDKIIHVVYADPWAGDSIAATRRREMTQRNYILQGLVDAADDDIVLISDVDEIPRRELIPASWRDGAVAVYLQKLFYYNFNTYAPDRLWPGTRVATAADVKALSPHIIRNGIGQKDDHYPLHGQIMDGGWHCSYFGDVHHIQNKMASFLHQELVSDENSDPDTIARRMADGIDIWGREHEQQFVIGPATDLPWGVRAGVHKWTQYFHPDYRPTFHEEWYPHQQAAYLGWLAQQVPSEGAYIEIGCWEGRSTIAIAQTIAPTPLIAVDHWQGNVEEGVSRDLAAERDVYATFARNLELLTSGNVQVHRMDWREWMATWEGPIAFMHIDASHDYDSVADCIRAVLPYVVKGGILCGDDYHWDGVYRAVHDLLGTVQEAGGRLWVWQKTGE